ncbi:hypothetical protein [Amaricoccus sp.]|uniref:hypothetical protein n=1 Tax=Amaricoccus sp. TaxID=1872485 RepID=UPI001B79E663|nr:hypothetical protein [Amaricoccus sp.]MBP7003448.1 hypothetical protein [Amaricoccus sp.]
MQTDFTPGPMRAPVASGLAGSRARFDPAGVPDPGRGAGVPDPGRGAGAEA